MYLREKKTGDLVEVLDLAAMVDPNKQELAGRFHAGEELQDPEAFAKDSLEFPSGESLPRCWLDVSYRAPTH